MPFSLSSKTAIVTGGASGIGLEVVRVLSEAGASVHLLDLSSSSVSEAANQLNSRSGSGIGRVVGHVCDVTSESNVKRVFDEVMAQAKSEGRRLDCLVNNAGISTVGNVEKATADDLERVLNVNVKGVFHGLKYGVGHMLSDGKGGAIVNLASIASLIGMHDRFTYSASKGAVLTMTYSVATDYVRRGIRCNCVCPARVHTPFVDGYLRKHYTGREEEFFRKFSDYQPIGRMAQPREIAHLILYLCSDESSFVTGSAYPIDGGVVCKM